MSTKLSPPWFNYFEEIYALFGEDPEISIRFDTDNMVLRLYVDNTDKAEALDKLLPKSVSFGNVELKVEVVPSNEDIVQSKARLFEVAFRGNPVVTDVVNVDDVFSNPIMYIEFRKEVIQYYNDDLTDLHGNRSTLLQDIAREVFDDAEGVYFCTAADEEEEE